MLGCCDGRLLLLLLLGIEKWVREGLIKQERGERKKYKIINRRGTVIMHKIIGINRKATVIVHICTIIVAIVHKCTFLHPLMWVFFYSKCVK